MITQVTVFYKSIELPNIFYTIFVLKILLRNFKLSEFQKLFPTLENSHIRKFPHSTSFISNLMFIHSQIKPENKSLLSVLCTEQILSYIYPDEVKRRKADRKASYDIDDLKQKIAQSASNVVLSNREMKHLRYGRTL